MAFFFEIKLIFTLSNDHYSIIQTQHHQGSSYEENQRSPVMEVDSSLSTSTTQLVNRESKEVEIEKTESKENKLEATLSLDQATGCVTVV